MLASRRLEKLSLGVWHDSSPEDAGKLMRPLPTRGTHHPSALGDRREALGVWEGAGLLDRPSPSSPSNQSRCQDGLLSDSENTV